MVIGADGTATVPAGAFDYVNITPGNTVDSFAEQATSPIALTAAVIVPVSDNVPDVLAGDDFVAAGPISDPIFLSNPSQTPVGGVVLPSDSLIVNGNFENNPVELDSDGNGFGFLMGFFPSAPTSDHVFVEVVFEVILASVALDFARRCFGDAVGPD